MAVETVVQARGRASVRTCVISSLRQMRLTTLPSHHKAVNSDSNLSHSFSVKFDGPHNRMAFLLLAYTWLSL